MAMIKCPECGGEISDKARKCIHCGKVLIEDVWSKKFCSECGREVPIDVDECPFCGYPFEDEQVIDNYNVDINPKKNDSKKIKKVIIPVTIIAVIAIIVTLTINFMRNNLNEDEQLAYQNVIKMQSMMRDPDSFRLYDEMFLIKYHNDDGNVEYTYTIFKYGGANGYGAITTDEAIFKDGKYIMDYADEPDEEDSNYMEQLGVKVDLALFVLSGENDTWEVVDIDIEKIKRKMGLE